MNDPDDTRGVALRAVLTHWPAEPACDCEPGYRHRETCPLVTGESEDEDE